MAGFISEDTYVVGHLERNNFNMVAASSLLRKGKSGRSSISISQSRFLLGEIWASLVNRASLVILGISSNSVHLL